MKLASNLYQHTEKLIKQWIFPSSKNSHFQNEAKCKTFLVKMSLICMRIKYHFHVSSFALSLALKQRLGATRKWPINSQADKFQHRGTRQDARKFSWLQASKNHWQSVTFTRENMKPLFCLSDHENLLIYMATCICSTPSHRKSFTSSQRHLVRSDF